MASKPTITGTVPGQTTTSAAPINPFAHVTVGDANFGATDTLTITLSNGGAGGTLSGTGLSGGTGGVYTLSGTAAQITSKLDALVFTPTAGAPNTSSTTTFTLRDQSSALGAAAVDNSTSVIDSDPALTPTITGTVSGQTTTSEQTVNPFAHVTVGDANFGATDTLTITLSNGGAGGTLSGTGLSGGTGGVYTLSGTAAQITSKLDALVFTPTAGAPNTSSTTTFTLRDQSSALGAAAVDNSTNVIDSDPAVTPTITGTVSGQTTTSEQTVNPFAHVTVGDANFGATDTLTIDLSNGGADGTLADGADFSGLTGSAGSYTLSGTAAEITSELHALVFTPTAGAANTSSTTTFTLSDQSSAGGALVADDSSTSVENIDPAVAPTITGTVSGQTTTSEQIVNPFLNVTVGDANFGATDTLTIDLSNGGADGTLADGADFSGLTGSAGSYTLSGTAAEITSELHALVFTPTAGAANTSSTTTFTLSDQSSALGAAAVDNSTSVIDSDPAVAPTITGTVSGQTTTSEQTVNPFAHVTVGDANFGATDTLTIDLSNGGADGTLADGADFSGLTGSAGSYTLSGTAAEITSELHALVFTPTAGAANTSSTTTFTLSDQSSAGGALVADDSSTSVENIDPAVAPTITGTVSGQTTTSEQTVNPFLNVTVGDANFGATDTLTIDLSNGGADGTLADGADFSGLTGSAGSYTLSGTAAEITSELHALVFTPTAGAANTSSTTTFTLSDQSSAGGALVADDSSTSVENIDPAVAPTITGTVSGQTTTSEQTVNPFLNVTVGDANFGATDTLTIDLSNGGADGTLADGADFSGLTGSAGSYTLSGTAAEITSELHALVFTPTAGAANTSSTTTFTLSDQSSAGGALVADDSSTSVENIDPAVAPTITGTHVATTTSEASVKPFANVTVGDANSGATDTLTITLGGAGGTLADGTGFSGLTYVGAGVYTLSGAAADITSELGALDFTPATSQANAPTATTFTLSDLSSAYTTATSDSATTVVDIVPVTSVHANDISRSGNVTGPNNFIDLLNLEASYGDLIHAFGTNTQAMQNWFNGQEPIEHRADTFDGLDYIASYSDLISAFKSAGSERAVLDAGASHFITNGSAEGRTTTFNGLDYIASYGDLINAFGANGDAGAYHYIENGASEGRTTTFDGLDYIASYSDLIKAFGANEQAGAAHFIANGSAEGRTTTFDGLDYIAGYTDLMTAFGANNDAGASHYIQNGLTEGRQAQAFDVGAYETAHPDLIGKYASNDAFLTAYISTYQATGKFLT